MKLLVLQSVINFFVIYVLSLTNMEMFYIFKTSIGNFTNSFLLIINEVFSDFLFLLIPYELIFIFFYWTFEEEITKGKQVSIFNKILIKMNLKNSFVVLHSSSVILGVITYSFIISCFFPVKNWLNVRSLIYNLISSIIFGFLLLFNKKLIELIKKFYFKKLNINNK
jgi:hypothetical protein